MKISIIVPVYKAELYLKNCVETLLVQDYLDYEIILVDDGSPDQSGKICDEYGEKYPHVHVVHQQNSGVSAARNAGIKAAGGRYITFVDADDWADRDHLSLLAKHMQPGGMSVCGYIQESSAQGEISEDLSDAQDGSIAVLDRSKAQISALDPRGLCGAVWNKLFDGDIIKQHGISFCTDIAIGEDELFVIQYLSHITQSVIWAKRAAYHYRKTPDSAMNRTKKRKGFNAKALRVPTDLELQYADQDPEVIRAIKMRDVAKKAGALYEMEFNGWQWCEYYKPYLRDVRKKAIPYLCYGGSKSIKEKILVSACCIHPRLSYLLRAAWRTYLPDLLGKIYKKRCFDV